MLTRVAPRRVKARVARMDTVKRKKRRGTWKGHHLLIPKYLCFLYLLKLCYVLVKQTRSSAAPDFLVVGFYERKLPCNALISFILGDVDVLLVDISKYNGSSAHIKQTNALRALTRHNLGRHKTRSFGHETIILSIDIKTVSIVGSENI